jgi:hypothetical protein
MELKVRFHFMSISSAFLPLLLGICQSQGKVFEIKVAMNDSPVFQCHVSDGCSAISPQITALLDSRKQMNSLPRGSGDLFKAFKAPGQKKSASSFECSTPTSTDKIRSTSTVDEYHERSTERRNTFLCYWATILMFLFSLGSFLKFGGILQLYQECTVKKFDVTTGVVDSSAPNHKIFESCDGHNRNESCINSIEMKLAAIVLIKASLQMERIRPESLAVNLTTAIMLREKVLNQIKAQEQEIRNLQARFTVSCRIAHDLTDELHHTLLHTRETIGIECTRRTSLQEACLLPGSAFCRGCDVPSKELLSSNSERSRQLCIKLADSFIMNPTDFIPLFENDTDSDDSDYLSAMTSVRKKLADDLDSMNSKLSSETRETLNSLTSEEDSMIHEFLSPIGSDRLRKSDDESQHSTNSVGCNEDVEDDDDAQSNSQRIVSRNDHRFTAVGNDFNACDAQCKKSAHDLTDISTNFTSCVGGRCHGSSKSSSDTDEDDDNDDRSCFRPLTLFSMSTLSSRQSPTTTVSNSANNTGTVGEFHDTYDTEIARLTDELEAKIKRQLTRRREFYLKSPPDDVNNIGVDSNRRLGFDIQSDSCFTAISKSNRTAPSKIPPRFFLSSSNPSIVDLKD